jgi:diguanylate cyclase (GGDEF)-like protein
MAEGSTKKEKKTPDFDGDSHTVAIKTDKMKLGRLHRKGELIPVLTVIDGPRIGSVYRFTKPGSDIVIGRAKSEFVIKDETVSRHHARVAYVRAAGKQVVSITDLGSTNGTYVNGQETKRSILQDGDRIQLGDVLLRFEMVDPIDAKYISDVSRMIKAAEWDPLTGLYTRKYLEDEVPKVFSYLKKREQNLCLLMVDIDHFKVINDLYGHPTGDEVLRQLGRLIRDNIRGHDIPIRYGGEEVTIFLPGCDKKVARQIAERLRTAVEAHRFDCGSEEIKVTISIGLAELAEEDTVESLISRADDALYDAKRAGRNCLRER